MTYIKRGIPRPIRGLNPHRLEELKLFTSAVLSGGMFTSIDPADIPDEGLSLARNARVRLDKVSRRVGKSVFSASAPNSDQVKKLIRIEESSGSVFVIRLTQEGGHYTEGSSWTALSGTLSGGKLFIDHTVVSGNLIISNGTDKLQKVDLSAGTISDLDSSAPKARFVTGFADRIIAASVGDTAEGMSTLYWSGNRNYTEFDAAEDISAGNKPLPVSGSEDIDPISGLFGLTTVMIIPREKSIWLSTKQAAATDPLNPYSVVSGIGADIPSAIAKTESGIIFLSVQNEGIFDYTPGVQLGIDGDVGWKVSNDLLTDVEDSAAVFSAYDKYNKEYLLGLPNSDFDAVKLWVWNRKTQGWSYDEVGNASAVLPHSRYVNYTSIDDLTGVINDLTGTIDELSATPKSESVILLGCNDGVVLEEDSTVVQDNSVDFTFELRSKEFKLPVKSMVVGEINFEYNCTTSGTVTISYSRDGGSNWTTAKEVVLEVGEGKLAKYKKALRSKRLMWRLTSTDGIFDIINYEVHHYASGESST